MGEPAELGRHLERGDVGRDYWLSHCQGFRVDSADGRVGIVEEVVFASRRACPDALAVRGGLFGTRLLLVLPSDVEAISPRQRRLLIRAPSRRGVVKARA